jgi:phosphoribosylformimino-5-aminoimidazole carboxamide ribonucleotide (ProFAR) isomerase
VIILPILPCGKKGYCIHLCPGKAYNLKSKNNPIERCYAYHKRRNKEKKSIDLEELEQRLREVEEAIKKISP